MAAISCTKGDLIVVWLLSEVLWDLKVSLEFENWKCCRCRRLEPACKTRPFFARRSAWIVSSAAASPSCNFQVIFALKHNWYEWSYCSVPLFIYLCFSRIGLALDTDKHTFLFSCSILLTAVPHLVAFFSSKLAYVQQCRVCWWWRCDLLCVEIRGTSAGSIMRVHRLRTFTARHNHVSCYYLNKAAIFLLQIMLLQQLIPGISGFLRLWKLLSPPRLDTCFHPFCSLSLKQRSVGWTPSRGATKEYDYAWYNNQCEWMIINMCVEYCSVVLVADLL